MGDKLSCLEEGTVAVLVVGVVIFVVFFDDYRLFSGPTVGDG